MTAWTAWPVGVATISSLTMLVIAMLVSDSVVALMMAALAGGCIGFMPYNMNPAKIFMGDTGSTFLGFVLATVSIEGLFKFYTIISFAVPFLMLGLPLFDTCLCHSAAAVQGSEPHGPPTAATSTTGSSTWALTRSRRWPSSMWSAPFWACRAVVLTTSGAAEGHGPAVRVVPGGTDRRQTLPGPQRGAEQRARAGPIPDNEGGRRPCR